MKARDLEKQLAANGMGAPKMDMVMRSLRAAGEVPTGGRGLSAPNIDPKVAAKILIATAGSSKGASADRRLGILAELSSRKERDIPLLSRLEALLADEAAAASVYEVSIGRNVRLATIKYADGQVEEFMPDSPKDYKLRVRVTGTIPGQLIQDISKSLNLKPLDVEVEHSEEPDDD